MLALMTDIPDPLAEFRTLGIDARIAWSSDYDSDAMVLVAPEPENLRRLDRWLGGRPRIAVAA
jgi:hypothetical protein